MAKENIKLGIKVDGVQDVNKATEAVKDLQSSVNDVGESVGGLGNELGGLSDAVGKLQALKTLFVTMMGAVKATGAAIQGAMTKGIASTLAFGASIKGAGTRMVTSFKDGLKSIRNVDLSLRGMGRTGKKALTSILTNGKKAFKGLGKAALATGIGAIIIGFVALIGYLKNTEKGARALAIATQAFKIIMDKLMVVAMKAGTVMVDMFKNPKVYMDKFLDFIKVSLMNALQGIIEFFPKMGEALKLAFKGDFSEAAEVAGNAVLKITTGQEDAINKAKEFGKKAKEVYNEFTEDVEKAVVAATKLVDGQEALRKAINAVKVENAQLNRELETQKQIGEDTTKGYAERRVALLKAGEAQVAIANNSREEARLNLSLLQLQRSMTSNIEERRGLDAQVADARAAQIEAQTAYEIELQDVKKVTREIDIEELERVKAISDIMREANIDITLSEFEEAMAKNKIDEEAALFELNLLKATEGEKQKVRDGFAKQREDLTTGENDAIKAATEKDIKDLEEKEQARLDLEKSYVPLIIDVTKSEYDLKRDEIDKFYADKAAAMKKSLDDGLISQGAYDKLIVANTKAHNDEIAVVDAEAAKAAQEAKIAVADKVLGYAQTAVDIVDAITAHQEADVERSAKAKSDAIDEGYKAETKALDAKLTSGELSQKEYDKAIEAAALAFDIATVTAENKKIVALNEVRKKSFIANKAMGIANATVDVVKGAIGAFTSLSNIPVVGVPLGIAAAIAASAAGAINIASMAKTKFEPTSLGEIPSAIATPPSAPTNLSLFGQSNNSSVTQDSQALGSNQQSSIRAYVVEQDITDTQNTLNQYRLRSEIG